MKRKLVSLSLYPNANSRCFLGYMPHWALQPDYRIPVLKWVLEVIAVNHKPLIPHQYFVVEEGRPVEISITLPSGKSFGTMAGVYIDQMGKTKAVRFVDGVDYNWKPFWNRIIWPTKVDCVFPNNVTADIRKGLASLIQQNYLEQTNAGVDQATGVRID